MKIVHQVKDSLYVTDVVLRDNDEVPDDCVEVPLPAGIFLPAKFENGVWSTTLPEAEVVAKLNVVSPTPEVEDLKKQQADLIYTLMMNGVI